MNNTNKRESIKNYRVMKTVLRVTALIMLFSLSLNSLKSQEFPMPEEHFQLVNDMAGVLTWDQADILEVKHGLFYDTTEIVVVIVTVDDLLGMNLRNFSRGLYKEWHLETFEANEAILITVYREDEQSRPRAYIHTEGKYRDLITPRVARTIVSADIDPFFAQSNVMSGLNRGGTSIMAILSEEVTPRQYMRQRGGLFRGSPMLLIIAIAIVAIFATRSMLLKKAAGKKEEAGEGNE